MLLCFLKSPPEQANIDRLGQELHFSAKPSKVQVIKLKQSSPQVQTSMFERIPTGTVSGLSTSFIETLPTIFNLAAYCLELLASEAQVELQSALVPGKTVVY